MATNSKSHPGRFKWRRIVSRKIPAYYKNNSGVLLEGDMLSILPEIKTESVDLVFANPPFNLGKKYRASVTDCMKSDEYLLWCQRWLDECIRVLKPGGTLFLYNLPKWNMPLGVFLSERGLSFRHWIAIERYSMYYQKNKLYPAHYSLLYFTKGNPKYFASVRTPVARCRHCDKVLKKYTKDRKYYLSHGINLKDVWVDIPAVKPGKHKSPHRKANALSTRITDRVLDIATRPGDVVLDPFGGSGTTFDSCQRKGRHWIGIEIDYCDDIVYRLTSGDVVPHENIDITC